MTTLRIGYTCHDAFPSTDTNTQQIFWTLSEVARLGHEVDLRVPKIQGGADARALIARHYGAPGGVVPDGLRFVETATASSRHRFGAAWFDLCAPWRFSRRTHDVVWTRDPLALASALQRRLPAVFETYRPDFATAPAFAPWRFATIGHSRRMARVGSLRLAGVIAHSRLAADAFVAAGVSRDRVLVAHNGHAPALMEPVLSRVDARIATGLPVDAPLVVYAGHVGPRKGTDVLVALAAALPRIRMVIVGVDERSDDRRWIEECARRAGATNLILVPRVGVSEVATYLYAADCLVIPPTDEPLTRYGRTVLPMKLFPYLAAGRPILAPRLPDVEELLADGRTAVLVPPRDVPVAAAALGALLDAPSLQEQLSTAARELAGHYTWKARAEKIAAAIGAWIA